MGAGFPETTMALSLPTYQRLSTTRRWTDRAYAASAEALTVSRIATI